MASADEATREPQYRENQEGCRVGAVVAYATSREHHESDYGSNYKLNPPATKLFVCAHDLTRAVLGCLITIGASIGMCAYLLQQERDELEM
jgi:hypothetical protein